MLSKLAVTEKTSVTNYSGFSVVLNGYKNRGGYYTGKGKLGYYWSLTEVGMNSAYYRRFNYNSGMILRSFAGKDYGFSVRCIRDSY